MIAESAEDNNVLIDKDKLTVYSIPQPVDIDLTPSKVLASEHQVLQGAKSSFTFDVANIGPDAAPAYSVGLYYSNDPNITTGDTLICTHKDLDGLGGMAQEALQVSCDVPKINGNYYFGVIVDPAKALPELDDDNSVGGDPAPVTVALPNVDLQMGIVSSSDFSVDTGQKVTLSADVTNAGPLAPAAQTLLAPLCAVPPVPTGSYWLGAIADATLQIAESNETNNAVASVGQMTVTAPDVDLQYELHWDDANNPKPGQLVNYHLQIRNNGTASSPAQFDVSLHYSLDDIITPGDAKACTVAVGAVKAKTITEFQFECNIPALAPGWYYSGIVIDPANQVPESNETNNWGSDVFPELIQ